MTTKIKIACPCLTYQEKLLNELEINEFIQCNICKSFQHKKCIEPSINMEPYYICPKCQIDKSDLFLEEITNLIRPRIISYNNNKYYDINFEFELDDFSKYTNNDVFIINCIVLGKNPFLISWPGYFQIIINGKLHYNISDNDSSWVFYEKRKIKIKFNSQQSDNKSYKIYKKNISKYFKPGKNEIRISFQFLPKNFKTKYVISIDLVKILTLEQLMKNIPYDIYKSSNDNIKETIDFLEPLTQLDYINIPGRGINCKHLKCFDIEVFLKSSQLQQIFNCPFCKKKVGLLYKDLNMEKLLKQYQGSIINIDEHYNVTYVGKGKNNIEEEKNIEEKIIDLNENYSKIELNKRQNLKKKKYEMFLIGINKKLFPFFNDFQNDVNFNYIQKYAKDIILPQYLNHKSMRENEEKEKKINSKNANGIGIDEKKIKENKNTRNNILNNYESIIKNKKNINLIFKDDNDEEFIDINKMPFLLDD